jgi:hypothetical protein
MTKVDAALDAVLEVAEAMSRSKDRIETALLCQRMRRRVEAELARARADEAGYEAPTP